MLYKKTTKTYKTPIKRLKITAAVRWEGKTFGQWEIKEYITGTKMAVCQCITCGEFEIKCPYGLKKERSKRCNSCIELSCLGKKFGKWTVIKPAAGPEKERMFICKCICGRIEKRRRSNLLDGKSIQCTRCAANQKSLPIEDLNIIGTRFNNIIFKEIVYIKNRKKIKCLCDCGTAFFIDPTFVKTIKGYGCSRCANSINGKKAKPRKPKEV